MKIRKILAMILAAMTVLGSFVIPAAADDGDSYDLYIAFGADPEGSTAWAYQYYGATSDKNVGDITMEADKIAVGETKTVKLTLPEEAATTYFIAPVIALGDDIQKVDFDIKVSIDGTDVTDKLDYEVDAGEKERKWWHEDGVVRLAGGYNQYAEKRCYLPEAPVFTTIEYTVTLNDVSTEAPADDGDDADKPDATEAEGPAFDPSSDEYVAQMFIQIDSSWVFRNSWSEPNYGAGVSDYQYGKQLSDVQDSANPVPHDGTFTDVVLKGNGTYTLTLENPDFTNGGGVEGTKFNQIGISTSIPYSGADKIKVTDMTIKVNDSGMLKYTYDEAVISEEAGDKQGYIDIMGVNAWNSDICTDANNALGTESAWPGEVSKVEITFTISGFDHDAPAADEPAGDDGEGDDGKGDATTAASDNNSSNNDSKESSGLPVGAIIGIVCGVVVIIVIIIVVVTTSKKKKS